MSHRFEIVADEEVVWSGAFPPKRSQLERAAKDAEARGWNGTTMDLVRDGEWQRFLYPSNDMLTDGR